MSALIYVAFALAGVGLLALALAEVLQRLTY